MSFAGRESMLSELIDARELFKATDALVSDLVRQVAAAAGIEAEQFDETLEAARVELLSHLDD
jgi:hypothetical protein